MDLLQHSAQKTLILEQFLIPCSQNVWENVSVTCYLIHSQDYCENLFSQALLMLIFSSTLYCGSMRSTHIDLRIAHLIFVHTWVLP